MEFFALVSISRENVQSNGLCKFFQRCQFVGILCSRVNLSENVQSNGLRSLCKFPNAARLSGNLCSGVNLSGKCATKQPETEMSRFSSLKKQKRKMFVFVFKEKRNLELLQFPQPFRDRVRANVTESRNVNKFVKTRKQESNFYNSRYFIQVFIRYQR